MAPKLPLITGEAITVAASDQRNLNSFLRAVNHKFSEPLTALQGNLELALLQAGSVAEYRRRTAEALVEVDRLVCLKQLLVELAEAEDVAEDIKET